MSAAKRDLQIERGGVKSFTLRIVDAFGDPVAVTGGSTAFKAEIREAHRKPLVAAFTCTALGDGTLRLSLTSVQTLTLDVSRQYQWDLYWTDTANARRRLLYGAVVVEPNITQLS
jgi:hypothetical protein